MRITFELENKFVAIEISDLDDAPEDEAEEFQHIVLPMGFQPPPVDTEDIEYEQETEA